MSKKVFLLLVITLLTIAVAVPIVSASAPLATNATSGAMSDLVTTPAVQAAAPSEPERAIPPFNVPGFYLETALFANPIPAADIHATGSYRFWSWSSLNPGPNSYRWDQLDAWIERQVAAGYQGLGIAPLTYTGRATSCGAGFGIDNTPAWVLDGPDHVRGTTDDPIVISKVKDRRDCDGDANPDNNPDWPLPKYWDTYYQQQYAGFVRALAAHLLAHPRRDKIAWVAIGTGKDGENKPTDNDDDDTYLALGFDENDWIKVVKDIVDIYRDAFYDSSGFPNLYVLIQNAPFYRVASERRDIANYAASKNVGLSVNGVVSDFNFVESCDSTNPTLRCSGIWDQNRQYANIVPSGFETYGYMMPTANEFYWGMARALDSKADFIRMSYFWDYPPIVAQKPDALTIAEWGAKYMGTGFQLGDKRPSSIWSRSREHRIPCFYYYDPRPENCDFWPTVGNYEFYLKQLHNVTGGTTIPVTSDKRVTSMGWSDPNNEQANSKKPYHRNLSPYDALLPAPNLTGPTGVPIQVDPGWAVRRSNQANNNNGFYYDAADRYIGPPSNPAKANIAVITVTYFDQGTDRWMLIYDAVAGPKPAQVYAIQNYSIRAALAIDGGVPGIGVINPKTPYVQKTDSKTWKVATFVIEDGYFGNRLTGGSDFYIDSRSDTGAKDGDEYIHHIDLQKLDEITQPTPTPTITPSPTINPTNTNTPTITPTPTVTATATPTPTVTPSFGRIAGVVYEDINGNSTPDAGEGLAGAVLTLTGSASLTTTSAANGSYEFDNLTSGSYLLAETPPDGYGPAKPVSSIQVPVQANSTFTWNFAHDPLPTSTATPTATLTRPTPTLSPTTSAARLFLPMLWQTSTAN